MEENDRILAAKKAVLALFKAVKRRDRRNIVDLVGFDTDVRPMDLVSVWESKPGGFTNTGAALKTAAELLRHSRSDQNLVYLITDGYPEAYTDKDGKSMIGSGWYHDILRRENGRWRFVRRDMHFRHHVPLQQGWATSPS